MGVTAMTGCSLFILGSFLLKKEATKGCPYSLGLMMTIAPQVHPYTFSLKKNEQE